MRHRRRGSIELRILPLDWASTVLVIGESMHAQNMRAEHALGWRLFGTFTAVSLIWTRCSGVWFSEKGH
jgi:hypothetical protein